MNTDYWFNRSSVNPAPSFWRLIIPLMLACFCAFAACAGATGYQCCKISRLAGGNRERQGSLAQLEVMAMKKSSFSRSAFFHPRVLIGFVLSLIGLILSLFVTGVGLDSANGARRPDHKDLPGTQRPDLTALVGPKEHDIDLRNLSKIPPDGEHEERRLTRHPFPLVGYPGPGLTDPSLIENEVRFCIHAEPVTDIPGDNIN